MYTHIPIPYSQQQLASFVLAVAQLINWFNNKNKAQAALALLERLTETKKLPSFLLLLSCAAIDCRGLAFFEGKNIQTHLETIKNGNLYALPFSPLLAQSYVSHALLMSGYDT